MKQGVWKKDIICSMIVFLIVACTIPSISENQTKETASFEISTSDVISEVDEIKDKILVMDKVIGNRHVKYWKHFVDCFTIKNDSILLHLGDENDTLVERKNKWSDLEFSPPDCYNLTFTLDDYLWKKPVVFPDKNDCGYFYTFCVEQTYPVTCWEVRHTDGATILYDFNGTEIGHGVPAPSVKGFSLSGYDRNWADPWIDFRKNANSWFREWCNSTVSISLPTPNEISNYVSNPQYKFFYELAHGASTYFQADSSGSCYNSSDVEQDMADREKMTFAFIGSCHGMTDTSSGTFSYEFRKGSITDTVTIGYDRMDECAGWSHALQWQNYMFSQMDEGYTIKKSFDLACAEFPSLIGYVVFVGDQNLTVVNNPPEKPSSPIGETDGKAGVEYTYTTNTNDPDDDQVWYLWDWGDGTTSEWMGAYDPGETCAASRTWSEKGDYEIKVKAEDEHGSQSDWSDPLQITMPKNKTINPFILFLERLIERFPILEQI
ncbi:MAG: hypothetical protein KAW47_11310, partial [Thermoplasmatales archaeon]|nr:hypothetical protein [Thermoplasmatales archaeon]